MLQDSSVSSQFEFDKDDTETLHGVVVRPVVILPEDEANGNVVGAGIRCVVVLPALRLA
jgi:hypothetical protein